MPVHNSEIAEILNRYATLLEIAEANPFRIRAYRRAARTIQELPHSAARMLAEGEDLAELPGIGRDLAEKITEIVKTGQLAALDDLERTMPADLAELATISGLGPKRVRRLHEELGIEHVADLAKAARAGQIRRLAGFGPKIEAKILAAVGRRREIRMRVGTHVAEQVAEPLVAHLKQVKGVGRIVVAGSYRRHRETVGDLDILVTGTAGAKVMDALAGYDEVREVVARGGTRSTVVLRSGLQVDLRVVPEVSYGAALHYFTGSKEHNIAIRKRAQERGLKLNEYGVFKGGKRIGGRTEEDVFSLVGLPYIEPELRENRGEIEAAAAHRLPRLVSLAEIHGDLHVHTKATDGRNSIEEMALAAKERGYDYLAISDHTRHVAIAHGLDTGHLERQIAEIERLNDTLKGIRILKSAEVDILEDGRLDLPDSILKKLDFTTCAIHYKFDLSAAKQTERILRAMDDPCFSIFGHPSGRLLGQREAYDIDMERVMAGALERGCHLEVNAQPERLDLTDIYCKMAKERGLKVAISTDAHSTASLDYMRYGIAQARRGWLEPNDVLNTRQWADLKKLLRR
ncbi:MAG: DNA polymerase/3'-5' exonuclease PolX [Alphaproteobacteria bacterium]